jgi:hypothetical protein
MPNFRTPTNEELNEIYMTDTEELDQYISSFLWTWGHNNSGQLGTNNLVHRSSPVQTIASGTNWKTVACGDQHTLGLKEDGALWAWGLGTSGQLGNNSAVSRSSPVQTVGSGSWRKISAGSAHSCGIKIDGTLWSWGFGTNGQMGNNSTSSRSSPVQTIAGGSNWVDVSCGHHHTAAVKSDGTLWLWGHNQYGQLGNNATAHRSSPVQTVAAGTNWRRVACGVYHTVALKTDGTLWTWGYNDQAALGDGTTTHRSSPVQISGTTWKKIAAGNVSAGIKEDGTLWVWGYNAAGQLADGSTVNKSSPIQVSGSWKTLPKTMRSGGPMGAIKNDGTLWLWGNNAQGQLGDSSLVSKSSPVQTSIGGDNWKDFALGAFATAAIPINEY